MPSFDHPWILWCGLPLAAAPLVIHLISLWRHRVVRWAAMEFLLAGQRRSRTRVLLRQLLLLAARTAALVGLVLALAQPRWRQPLGLFGGATAHLVVLDDSFSMADRSPAAAAVLPTAFERGAAVAERLADDLAATPGRHEIAVVLSSTLAASAAPSVDWRVVAPETLPALRDAVSRARASSGTSGCVAAVEAAASACRPTTGGRSVLWLVGDHRRRDWEEASAAVERLGRLAAAGVEIRIVDVAVDRSTPGNVGITRLEQAGGVSAAGVLVPIEVEVRNDGPAAVRDLVVEVREDGGARPAVRIDAIAAGRSAVRRFDVRFPDPGSHVVEAAVPADVLPPDDVRGLALDVADAVDVLVVEGHPRGAAGAGDGFFVAAALAPGGVVTGLRPRIETIDALATTALEKFAAVWLLDVPDLPADSIEALERYTRGGGGVVFFCGARTGADAFNSTMHRSGAGLFPVPLAGAVELLPAATGAATPDVVVEDHPVVAILAGGRNPLLDAVRVERLWAVARGHDLAASGCRRLLSVRTGQPLAVERRHGAGTVVAVLTSAAPEWNNWARGNPSWVVVLLELQAHLMRARRLAGAVRVGGDVDVVLEAGVDDPEIEFRMPPAGAAVRQTAQSGAGGELVARLPGVAVPGVYEAHWRSLAEGSGTRKIAVNVDADEGRLERAGRDGISRALAGVAFRYDGGEAFTAADRDAAPTLTTPLLLAVVGLLVLEQVVAYGAGYHRRTTGSRGS
ncbi:MAG: BatA domain-containing protein [Planctomycetota bacterium]